MKWPAVAFDWNQAKAFLATAEEGSLSAAARALNLTQPTVGRQVAALERSLGTALFERVGRSLSLDGGPEEDPLFGVTGVWFADDSPHTH